MPLFAVLNELSHSVPAESEEEGSRRIELLARTLVSLSRRRFDTVLVTPEKFGTVAPHGTLTIGIWGARPGNRDLWRRIAGLCNRAPFGSELLGDEGKLTEYFHGGAVAKGLGPSHRLDVLALSFEARPFAALERVLLQRNSLKASDDGTLAVESDDVEVPHASSPPGIDLHRELIPELGRRCPETGAAMWKDRIGLFSTLTFLPRVEPQFGSLRGGDPRLVAIFHRLRELDRCVLRWDPASAHRPDWESKVSPEAAGRANLCLFQGADGVEHLFDWHARFTPGAGRIHFRLLPGAKSLEVAHVGEKLGA